MFAICDIDRTDRCFTIKSDGCSSRHFSAPWPASQVPKTLLVQLLGQSNTGLEADCQSQARGFELISTGALTSQNDCDLEGLGKIVCATTSSLAWFEALMDAGKSLFCSPSHVRSQFDMIKGLG